MKRAALLCPGRGSYTERSLGTLPADHALVRAAEAQRRERGLSSLVELDRGPWSAAEHLAPANVSPLIYLLGVLDAEATRAEHELVCVGGNSLGWYTSLAVAGALTHEDGFRLVQTMSLLQQELCGDGGQLIHPLTDDAWRPDPELRAGVARALAGAGGEAFPSIDLGGFAVLAGSESGVQHLLRALPRVQRGGATYPLRLPQHGPYHSALAEPVSARARAELAELAFRRPHTTLVDGRGRRHSPWSADPGALRDYTFGAQVTEPYDFASSVRVALREFAPERLVLPGPGNSLGGVCGRILVAERWRGVHDKAAFDALQRSQTPVLVSMRKA